MRKKLYPILLLLSVMGLFAAVPFLLAAANSVSASGGFEVVASGLNNPRGMAFGADGALYIADWLQSLVSLLF